MGNYFDKLTIRNFLTGSHGNVAIAKPVRHIVELAKGFSNSGIVFNSRSLGIQGRQSHNRRSKKQKKKKKEWV